MLNFQRNYMVYRILDAFFRNWMVFLITLLGVAGVVSAVLVTRSAKYSATALIRLGTAEVKEIGSSVGYSPGGSPWTTASQTKANEFRDLLRETLPGGFVDRVFTRANLKHPINIDPQANDPRFDEMLGAITIAPASNDVLQISLTWPDREESEAVVKALQTEFIKQAGINNVLTSTAQLSFINSQIDAYHARLVATEQALVNFKRNHNNLMPDQLSSVIEAQASLKMQRDNLQITANDARLRLDALETRKKQIDPEMITQRSVTADPILQQIQAKQAERSQRLGSGYKIDGSIIKDIDAQIRALQRDLDERRRRDPNKKNLTGEAIMAANPEWNDIQQQIVTSQIAMKTQAAQIAELDKRIAQYDAAIAKLPLDERALTERTRDYKLVQDQYEDLLQRREAVKIKQDIGKVTAESTLIPLRKVFAESTVTAKKKMIAIATSVAVGLVVGLLLIVLREWMDPSLRYEVDTVRLLDSPVLASLPESPFLRFPTAGRGVFRRLSGPPTPALEERA